MPHRKKPLQLPKSQFAQGMSTGRKKSRIVEHFEQATGASPEQQQAEKPPDDKKQRQQR